jgi:class 3 adenylate cyclase
MRERATVTEAVPLSEAARRAGVTPQTLRRWAREGLVPQLRDGLWTPAAIAQARVVARLARAAGGEVLVTSPVVELAGAHLEFERIGEVRLKGFREATELFVAREIDDDG